MQTQKKPTLNVEEAARFLGLRRREVLRLCRRGLLKHIHLNPHTHYNVRFYRAELERFREGSNST